MEKKEFTLIPDGTDIMASLDSYEEKDNSKGTGRRGTLVFKISRGEFKDRKLFVDLNVSLPSSPKAEEMASDVISKFLKATGEAPEGLESIGHDRSKLSDFIGLPVVLVVGQKEKAGYTNKEGVEVPSRTINYVKAYKAR